MHSKKFLKRLFQPRDFYQLLLDFKQSVKHLGMLRSSRMLDKQFIERIMMAVTQVNGCQFCAYFHSRAALNAGISQGEVTRVLEGEFDDAPDEEIAALYFAQHYAETGGKPNAEALACLNNVYGNEKSNAIIAYIRAIMIGNAWGNMLDSLLLRISGKANNSVTLRDEIGVILGLIYMIPKIIVNHLFYDF